jgi:ion channel-forming bestrophin family protein
VADQDFISYAVHLWSVTVIFCLALVCSPIMYFALARLRLNFEPFQLWGPLGWITIPGTIVVSFLFFGFLVAGQEIESKDLDRSIQYVVAND